MTAAKATRLEVAEANRDLVNRHAVAISLGDRDGFADARSFTSTVDDVKHEGIRMIGAYEGDIVLEEGQGRSARRELTVLA